MSFQRTCCAILLGLIPRCPCPGQRIPSFVVSTVAGFNPVRDGQPALNSTLFSISDLAIDAAGNLYISELEGNRIRKVSGSSPRTATTYAGTGFPGFTGDGGPATTAQLWYPEALTLDTSGNLFVLDQGGFRIRRISPDGTISTYLDSHETPYKRGGAYFGASAITVDGAGNLYYSVANVVRKVTSSGQASTIAGTDAAGYSGDGGPAVAAQLNTPGPLVADKQGDVYVVDQFNHCIRKIATDGTITTAAGTGQPGFSGDGGPATHAQLNYPADITMDAAGNLYILDSLNYRVREVSVAGTITTYCSAYFTRIVLASDGNLYAADSLDEVLRYVPGGTNEILIDGPHPPGFGLPATQALLAYPGFVAVDATGNILYSDFYGSNSVINEIAANGTMNEPYSESSNGMTIDPSGKVCYSTNSQVLCLGANLTGQPVVVAGTQQTGFGGDGGPATAAQLNMAGALTLDSQGNLYVADRGNYRIRKVSADGQISTVAGTGTMGTSGDGGPATSAQVGWVACVATGASGSVYFCDGSTIRRISSAGIVSNVTGDASAWGYSRDGVPAAGAVLMRARSVATDANGNLYFIGDGDNRIRMITPDGILHTIAGSILPGFAGDVTGPATAALFNSLGGLAIDSSGALYVSDVGNHRIRKLTPNLPARLSVAGGDQQTGARGGCVAAPLSVQVTGTGGAGVAGVAVQFAVTPGTATVLPAATTDTEGVARTMVTLGNATGSVVVTASSMGLAPVTFNLSAADGIDPDTPCLSPGGAVGAALSNPVLKTLSPNGLASAFGQNFAPAGTSHELTSEDFVDGRIPTSLAGVCLLAGGTPAPLLFVNSSQINFQVPAVPTGQDATIQVVRNCGTAGELRSNIEKAPVNVATPEFFTLVQNSEGSRPIAAVDALTGRLIGDPGLFSGLPTEAAKPGDYVSLYLTGLGPTKPSTGPGELAGGVAQVTNAVRVIMNGAELDPQDVLYAGAAPGFAGLYQINIRVPSGSGTVPVAVRSGNATSPAGTYLYLRPPAN